VIIDRLSLLHLFDSVDVHAARVGNGDERGECKASSGKDPDGIAWRNKVEQTDGDCAEEDGKVGPLVLV